MPLNALAGSRIRERRIHTRMRQADLARAAGVSASYLNLIEHNRRRVPDEVLARIAQALGLRPEALSGAEEADLAAALRESAVDAPVTPDLDRADDFAGRFPGWAALVAAQHRRILQLEQTVEALSDRLVHDPHLSAGLHELLSAATSVRSTAAILAEVPDLEPDWRARFEQNLAQDTARLATGAEALVGYLDGITAQETGMASPQEELEAWLNGWDWHIPALESGGDLALDQATELASTAGLALARAWEVQARSDVAALPLPEFLEALHQLGPDPGGLAARFQTSPARVFRRMAMLPQGAGPVGLVVCDGSGALVLRKPLPGFALPRFGAACPLWPLYAALVRPGQPIFARVEMAGRNGTVLDAWAWCETHYPRGFAAPGVMRSYMILLPPGPAPHRAAPVGTSCRICPRPDCLARREPAIMGEGA